MAQAQDPLESYLLKFDLSEQSAPVSWAELFGNDHPVELEVGSGKGLFLANAGSERPGHNFLGVELSNRYARKAAERISGMALGNVKVVAGDAKAFLSRCVASESLTAVHVYFPDPWWKARHKKRRVFCEPLVVDIERALVPGGELKVATDVEEYFQVIRELVAGHVRFVERAAAEPRRAEHDLDYLTNFERKYRLEGRPIYRAQYQLA